MLHEENEAPQAHCFLRQPASGAGASIRWQQIVGGSYCGGRSTSSSRADRNPGLLIRAVIQAVAGVEADDLVRFQGAVGDEQLVHFAVEAVVADAFDAQTAAKPDRAAVAGGGVLGGHEDVAAGG